MSAAQAERALGPAVPAATNRYANVLAVDFAREAVATALATSVCVASEKAPSKASLDAVFRIVSAAVAVTSDPVLLAGSADALLAVAAVSRSSVVSRDRAARRAASHGSKQRKRELTAQMQRRHEATVLKTAFVTGFALSSLSDVALGKLRMGLNFEPVAAAQRRQQSRATELVGVERTRKIQFPRWRQHADTALLIRVRSLELLDRLDAGWRG